MRLVMDVSFSGMVVTHGPTRTRSTMMLKQISNTVKEMWLWCREVEMSCVGGMRVTRRSSGWRRSWQQTNGVMPASAFFFLLLIFLLLLCKSWNEHVQRMAKEKSVDDSIDLMYFYEIDGGIVAIIKIDHSDWINYQAVITQTKLSNLLRLAIIFCVDNNVGRCLASTSVLI